MYKTNKVRYLSISQKDLEFYKIRYNETYLVFCLYKVALGFLTSNLEWL